jgi:hypothetical protein
MPRRSSARMVTPLVAVLALAVAGTSPAFARQGRDGDGGGGGGGGDNRGPGGGGGGDRGRSEIRVAGTCGKGASSKLRLRSRDGVIDATFEVHHGRVGSTWRVTIVHEREVEYRGRRRMGSGRSFEVGYRMPDYSAADAVTVRATGPRGIVCVASATLAA